MYNCSLQCCSRWFSPSTWWGSAGCWYTAVFMIEISFNQWRSRVRESEPIFNQKKPAKITSKNKLVVVAWCTDELYPGVHSSKVRLSPQYSIKKKSWIFQIWSGPPTHPPKWPKSEKKIKIFHSKMIFRQFWAVLEKIIFLP